MKKEEKKISWFNVTFIIFIFVVGILFGFVIGTYTAIDKLAIAGAIVFSGSDINVEVNFNETEFINEFNKIIVPNLIEESKKQQEKK